MKIIITILSLLLFQQTGITQSLISRASNTLDYDVKKDPEKFEITNSSGEKIDTIKTLEIQYFRVNNVSLYGAGNVVGLVTASEDAKENASPTGSIGLNFNTDRLSIDLYFSYNSKQKVEMNTLAQFGNSLINPNLGGQSLNISTFANLYKYGGIKSLLKVADNTYSINETDYDASPMQFSFGGYLKPFDFGDGANKVNLTMEFFYTYRTILGDVANEKPLIEGQDIFSKDYHGIDLNLSAYLNDVRIYTQVSFNKKRDVPLPGFSGSQILFGLDVSGHFIKLK